MAANAVDAERGCALSAGPYAEGAQAYWRNGFGNPIPVGQGGESEGWAWFARRKSNPVSGYTGEKHADVRVSWPDLMAWTETHGRVNIGLKLQHGLLALDVDGYDGKVGVATLEAAEAALGPLPVTVVSTSRGAMGESQRSGIRLFKVPVSARFQRAQRVLRETYGRHVDVLHAGHRYAVVWPSVHPEGGTYRWWWSDGREIEGAPSLSDVAELPEAWLHLLCDRSEAPVAAVGSVPSAPASTFGFTLPSDRGELRSFTMEQAQAFCADAVTALRTAGHGDINRLLNDAACVFSHFVPAFWSPDEVGAWLLGWQREAWVASGRADDRDYDAARATIASGFGQTSDRWVAQLVADAPGGFAPSFEEQIHSGTLGRPEGGAVDPLDGLWCEFLDLDGLATLRPAEPLIKGLLYRETLTSITGAYGSLKTFVALDIALCVASGTTWHQREVRKGKVWYLLAEGVSGLRDRVSAWRDEWALWNDAETSPLDLSGFRVLPRAVQVKDDTAWAMLCHLAARERPDLIVVDTKARFTAGYEENSASETGDVVARIDALKRLSGGTVLVVHHTGWSGDRMRGSSAWGGALDTDILVEKTGDDSAPRAVVKVVKQKDAEPLKPFELQTRKVDLGVDVDGEIVTSLAFDANPLETPGESAADFVTGALDLRVEKHSEALVDLVAVMESIAPADAQFGVTFVQVRDLMMVGKTNLHPAVRGRVSRGAHAGQRGYWKVDLQQAWQYAAAYGWLVLAETPSKFKIIAEQNRAAELESWRQRTALRVAAEEADKTGQS